MATDRRADERDPGKEISNQFYFLIIFLEADKGGVNEWEGGK